MLKKFLLSVSVIGIFIIYAVHNKFGGDENPVVAINPTPNASTLLTTLPTASSTAQLTGKYKNGTYTGSVADAFYGNVQVQVTISSGKITDVVFLQSPNDRNTSIMINSQAMPMLQQEAIQVQSAQVSGVSGATATSQAFIKSLGNALSQAV
jgi:uncharacterized protein with FMN-binding domain